MDNKIDTEIKFIREALEEIKITIKQQDTKITYLPDKILIRTDEKYATQLEVEKLRSRLNWYAWLTPVLSGIAAFLAGRYL